MVGLLIEFIKLNALKMKHAHIKIFKYKIGLKTQHSEFHT